MHTHTHTQKLARMHAVDVRGYDRTLKEAASTAHIRPGHKTFRAHNNHIA